jgi:putative transposase
MDFSEFETARGGIWRICAVIDDATKYCLAATVTPTSGGQDALGCLGRAVVQGPNGSSTSTTSVPTAA